MLLICILYFRFFNQLIIRPYPKTQQPLFFLTKDHNRCYQSHSPSIRYLKQTNKQKKIWQQPEEVVRKFSVKNVFFKISENSRENLCGRAYFLNRDSENPVQVFP